MDPFLSTHQVGDLAVFQLGGGRLNSISIRDQMIRGQMLADRLPAWLLERDKSLKPKRIREEHAHAPILIIGGGACGLVIAVSLAQAGLRVHVVEKQDKPFYLQAGCDSRWVDPNQYDWPIDSFEFEQYPWPMFRRDSNRFYWEAARASRIVRDYWLPQLVNYSWIHRTNLKTYYSAVVTGFRLRKRNKLFQVDFEYADKGIGKSDKSREDYRAIILARGFGSEKTRLQSSKQFVGFPFWTNDPFESSNCGLSEGTKGIVLISGSGDGALQDFLRIITRQKSARDILWQLNLDGQAEVIAALHSSEHRAERALNWTFRTPFGARFVRELHKVHDRLISRMLEKNQDLQKRIKELASPRPSRTVLVNARDYFTCSYAMNRCLALFIIRTITDGTIELRESEEVVDITTAPPLTGVPTPHECVGVPWQVRLKNVLTGKVLPEPIQANVIVLRHGLDFTDEERADDESLGDMLRPMPPTHLA